MIVIELIVPCLGKTYNIRVKQNQKAGILLEEMLALLKLKTGDPEADTEGYSLFLAQTGVCLRKNLPMNLQGVKDGSRLILV